MKLRGVVCFFFLVLLCLGLFGNSLPQASSLPSGNVYGAELAGLPFSPSNVDVDSAGRIYVGTSAQGLWRSDDRGSTWTQINKTSGAVNSLFVDSRDYVFTQIGSKVYCSTDRGATWTQSMDTAGHGIWWMWDEDSNGYIYANNYLASGNDYIYRSIDQGATFSVWYNVSASSNPVRHIHSVDVAPNDYIFVTTGDSDITEIDDNTIRRWNGTAWEILAQSTASNDHEPRAIAIWFLGNYAYTAWDLASYVYRFPTTGTWSQREKIISTSSVGTAEMYDVVVIDGMVFGSTEAGYIFASWDGIHWVKIFEVSTGQITRMSSRKSFPLYFVDKKNYRLYRLNQVTKEDLVQQFYATYNSERGLVTNVENYVLEQRIYNGTNHIDLTSVALSNVQASVKGLDKINRLTNGGFETGDTGEWTMVVGSEKISVTTEDKYEGSYSAKVTHGLVLIRQQTTVRKGDAIIISWYMKSNDTISNTVNLYLQNASNGYNNLKIYGYPSVTSWTKKEIVQFFNVQNPFTLAFAFRFEAADLTTYFDASIVTIPQIGYQNWDKHDLIAYNPEFFNSTFFNGTINTLNPNITINGETVFHSGTLTNGSESSATSLTGILTGAVKVDANIQGSGQAMLKINGTRILYEDSIILRGRAQNVYYGRYYGTLSLATNTTDLISLTNLQANITSLSFDGSKLTLIVDSPSGTASTTKVYVGDKGQPKNVTGATSWSYDPTSKILTITALHSSSTTITVRWKLLGDINDDGTVDASDLSALSEAFGSTRGPPPSPHWNPDADLNEDNNINISDLYTLGKNYGKNS